MKKTLCPVGMIQITKTVQCPNFTQILALGRCICVAFSPFLSKSGENIYLPQCTQWHSQNVPNISSNSRFQLIQVCMFFTVVDIKNKIQVTVVSNQLLKSEYVPREHGLQCTQRRFYKVPRPAIFHQRGQSLSVAVDCPLNTATS